jgi:hypothetical protein
LIILWILKSIGNLSEYVQSAHLYC